MKLKGILRINQSMTVEEFGRLSKRLREAGLPKGIVIDGNSTARFECWEHEFKPLSKKKIYCVKCGLIKQ